MTQPVAKLLHTSDWHLGRVLHECSLLDDQRQVLDALVSLLACDPHDALVIAGDVFDRSVPPESAIELFGSFLAALRAAVPAIPVVVISGNHDSASRLTYASAVLRTTGVHLCGRAEDVDRPVRLATAEGAPFDIFCVPFLWPASFGTHAAESEVSASTQASAFGEAMARVSAARRHDVATVVVAHCFATGSVVADSERKLVGTATEVETGAFAAFDYVALGHLHRPQRVTERAYYSGSPLPYSFSESTDAKCFISAQVTLGAPPEVRRIPIALPRPMSVIRGTLTELVTHESYAPSETHYVKAVLTEAAVSAQPFAILRQRFPHLLSVVREQAAASVTTGTVENHGHAVVRDLEDDFVAFSAHLRGDAAADEDALRLFRVLRVELEGGLA